MDIHKTKGIYKLDDYNKLQTERWNHDYGLAREWGKPEPQLAIYLMKPNCHYGYVVEYNQKYARWFKTKTKMLDWIMKECVRLTKELDKEYNATMVNSLEDLINLWGNMGRLYVETFNQWQLILEKDSEFITKYNLLPF